nr:glycosyltransferase family 4 protein [uncultured Eisenbergiella sp.]
MNSDKSIINQLDIKSVQFIEHTKPKLLIYAHYYIPDVASTGQILKELAEGMTDIFDITVICVVPSYLGKITSQYKTQKYYIENINGVKIIRIRVPEFSKADKMSRVKNILAYFFGAMSVTLKIDKIDCVFAISQPPILGGLIGVWGKWVKRAIYIYNIQDFNPEQIIAINYIKNKILISAMMFFDKFSCRRSNLVITVGRDLVDTLEKRFTKNNVSNNKMPKVLLINNWVDERDIYPIDPGHPQISKFKMKYGLEDKFIFMYSGNIGHYYDLKNILKTIEKITPGTVTKNGKEVFFAFVGTGGMINILRKYKEEHHMDNVVFIPYQKKEELVYSLNAADVHFVVNAKGIKGVSCPSKFYGCAASASPVLAVLEKGSEIRCIIEESKCGLCCEPEDYEHIERNIRWFMERSQYELDVMGENGHQYLLKYLTKEASLKKYKEAILSCLEEIN